MTHAFEISCFTLLPAVIWANMDGVRLDDTDHGSDKGTLPVQANTPEMDQSVIELLSDDDDVADAAGVTEIPHSGVILINDDDDISDTDDPVQNDLDDDEVQFTGRSNVAVPREFTIPIPRERRPFANRNVRRRTDPDDDIEIIDERAVERRFRASPPTDEDQFRQSVLRNIHTPVGVFNTTELVPTPVARPDTTRYLNLNYQRVRNRRTRARGVRPRVTAAQMEQFQIPPHLINHFLTLGGIAMDVSFFQDAMQNESSIEGSIMDRIERDNESVLDRRMKAEQAYNEKALQEKKASTREEVAGYANNIKPDENLMCELCGIILGEGIPEDFAPNPQFDANFSKYVEQFNISAPWFCIKNMDESERVLSKRLFAAKCGHVFCGRCVRNIASGERGKRSQRKDATIENPVVSAPRKCPCGRQFRGKKSFVELYL